MSPSAAEKLIDQTTGFFLLWDHADRVDLYQAGLSWPLVTTIINGYGIPAPWPQAFGRTRSETLFEALREVSDAWTAFYIKHQDDAYAQVDWERQLAGDQVSDRLLEQFSSNPADQGGSSFLGLFVAAPEDMVLFTYAPTEFLRISLHGRMKIAVPAALVQRAG